MNDGLIKTMLITPCRLIALCCLSLMFLSACGGSDAASTTPAAPPTADEVEQTFSITTFAGSNGIITASSDVKLGDDKGVVITADAGFVVSDVFVDGHSVGSVTYYKFTNITTNHSIDVTFSVVGNNGIATSSMPIGIPAPSFGINETHEMYAGEFYTAGDFYYQDAGNGPYSHYVDNTDINATDTDNVYGTLTKPRVTIPDFVDAGSVVEIHGGPYTHKRGSALRLGGLGTAENPIFYRGTDHNALVRIGVKTQSGYTTSAHYIVIENLSLFKYSINPSEQTTVSNIALRNSDATGDANTGGVSVASWVANNWISNVVFYNLNIHNNGPWQTTEGDPDVHGVGIGAYVQHIWVLDSNIYHNAGNGIQLIGAGPSGNNALAHHIYLGRNYDNGKPNLQQFIGIKGASDVIISENHVSTQGGYRTNAAMSFQYGPERVWFLYNKIHDVNGGIGSGSNSVAEPGEESYVIGNLIYNIHQKDYSDWNPDNPWSNAAIKMWGGVNRYIIANTIYNVDAGIYTPSTGTFNIINNIISEVTSPGARHIYFESMNRTADSHFYNNVFSQEKEEGDVRIQWGSLVGDVQSFENSTSNAQHNIDADPRFNNTSTYDFLLQPNSAAIDAGLSEGIVKQVFDRFELLYGLDIRYATIDSGTRSLDSEWDIGAYEAKHNLVK